MDDILEVHARKYLIHHRPTTPEGLSAFFEHLVEVHNLSVKSVRRGSLIITVECPTLESLETLWNDYQSGCLDDIAESYLVTDELKRKLGLDHVRLRITIEEENYLICKKALMEISGELGSLYRALLGNMYFGLLCILEQFCQYLCQCQLVVAFAKCQRKKNNLPASPVLVPMFIKPF